MSKIIPIALAAGLCALPAAAIAQPVRVALDWAPNTNHIGLYVAQAQGFYDEAGLEVDILGPTSDPDQTDFSVFGVLDFYTLRAAGLNATAVMAIIQTETGRVAFDGQSQAISSPRDLAGGTYGGFGTTWERAIVDTMIEHDGGTPDYDSVTLNTTVYDALRSGEIDFTLEVLTWQGVENALAGHDIGTFTYADYGVPDQHTILLGAPDDLIETDPETVQAFVAASLDGYRYAIENPQDAVDILLDAAPELADQRELVEASLELMIADHYLMAPDGTIGTLNDQMMQDLGDFLFDADALVDDQGEPLANRPDFSGYYTNRFAQ